MRKETLSPSILQRSGKAKSLCKAHRKVTLELEEIFGLNSLSQAYTIVFLLTISRKDKKNS